MMTRVDELYDSKHMNMTFVEFIEAVGRVAERLRLPTLIEEGTNKLKEYDNVLKSIEFRRKSMRTVTPLPAKIETFIYMMSMVCLPREHNLILRKQILKFHKEKVEEKVLDSDDYTSSD